MRGYKNRWEGMAEYEKRQQKMKGGDRKFPACP
jgi:hypothetical protein